MAKTKESRMELAVIEPSSYPILVPDSHVTAMVAENMDGEELREFDLDRVSVPAGGGIQWIVPTAGGEESVDAIEGIILHIGKRRQFWAEKNPSGSPPDCHSRDMITGHGNPGGECEKCPHNEFGSAENERGKACKESRAVFILQPGEKPLPIVISVPPSSLKNLKQYLMRLPAPYFQCVTRLKLVRDKSADSITYSKVQPELASVLPQEHIETLRAHAGSLKKAFG